MRGRLNLNYKNTGSIITRLLIYVLIYSTGSFLFLAAQLLLRMHASAARISLLSLSLLSFFSLSSLSLSRLRHVRLCREPLYRSSVMRDELLHRVRVAVVCNALAATRSGGLVYFFLDVLDMGHQRASSDTDLGH